MASQWVMFGFGACFGAGIAWQIVSDRWRHKLLRSTSELIEIITRLEDELDYNGQDKR